MLRYNATLSSFELYPRWVPLRTGIRYIVNNSLTVWTLFFFLESCCYEQYILGQKQLMRPLDFKDENDYEYEI